MKIKDRLAKLIDVKTIVTFAITTLFWYLGAKGTIEADKVWEAFLIIVGFYFGSQSKKNETNNKEV
jgi:hypothetical protein